RELLVETGIEADKQAVQVGQANRTVLTEIGITLSLAPAVAAVDADIGTAPVESADRFWRVDRLRCGNEEICCIGRRKGHEPRDEHRRQGRCRQQLPLHDGSSSDAKIGFFRSSPRSPAIMPK